MKKYIFPAAVVLILLLLTACSVTPESTVEEALTPVVTSIVAPTITSVTSVNDEAKPSITVTWDPVDKADFYVFEYESAVDYLSAEGEFKSYITSSNTFTIPSAAFTNSSDMRFIFKVKAAHKMSSSRSIIYSSDSEIKEAVVLNTFSISPIIQDNVLTIYSTFPKIKSVLTGGNIIQPVIKYYSVDEAATTELESNIITLSSAEKKKIRADLIVEDEVVATREVDIVNAVDYYPSNLLSLNATANEKDAVTLTWEAKSVNAGLEDNSVTMRFYIERKEEKSDRWLTLTDDKGETLYIESSQDGGTFTYSDYSAENGKDYRYRVITQYVMLSGDTEITFDENKDNALVSDRAYIQDREVKSFILTPGKGFSGEPVSGDATYEVAMKWEAYHTLPEGMEYIVTRWDFDLITFVDGKATDESGTKEKYIEVYRGRDLGISHTFTLTEEENKSAHNYVYYLQIAPVKSSSDNPMTQAKEKDADGNLKDGIIKTNPSIKEVSFISSISATNGDKALSDSIVLNWTYNEESITAAGLDVTKVSVHILKRTSTDATYTDISEGTSGVSGTSYTDEDVESDNTYNYILKPYYNDSTSPYNGAQSTETDKRATGSLLGSVKEIEATINTSNTSIDVSWSRVKNAHGYVVYYREKDTADWTEGAVIESADTTVCTLSSNLTAGTRYIFTVSAVDNNKKAKASESITAEGEILGGVKNLKTTGDSDIKSDSIVLTWDEVENATSYFVSIYDDEGTNFFNETVHGTTYTLSATSDIIKAYSTAHEYALSRKYSFTVIPMVGSMKPLSEPTKVTGYWVMPPKNITATKASYRDLITVSWDSVSIADGYVIYYREHGSSDAWQYLNNVSRGTTSFDYLNSSDKYDFSISTVKNNIEGLIQDFFVEDSNYGYALLTPQMLTCTDMGDYKFFKISFKEVEGATSYQIKFEDSSWELNASEISTTALTSIAANKAEINENGLISYYISRPTPKYKLDFTASVAATNGNAEISSKNTTSYNSTTVIYSALSDNDLIRIALYNLNYIFRMVNTQFNSEWWPSSEKTLNSSGLAASTCHGTSGFVHYNPEHNGYINLSNYSQFGNIISGNITCYVEAEQTNGYLGDDPLERISSSKITIQLPYKFDDITISYDNYYVYKNTGTAKITVNGNTYDLNNYSPLLLQEI